ncbi:MAG: glycosyltransferase family 2 protein [Chloroflexota bacterium]|nr:glycosyltransferase family 2 protein [Chloroflexota bacterium]
MIADNKLTIVIPAYNEEAVIGNVVSRTRATRPKCEILVVDDGSTDQTAVEASRAGARVVRHPYNKGNGAAVKTGIRAARGEVILLLDADGQHSPENIDRLLEYIGPYDLVVGSRTSDSATHGYRNFGNWVFSSLASYLVEMKVPDPTSGFRCFKRDKVMDFIHLLPNQYSYPTTTTMSFIKAGYNVKHVPLRFERRQGGKSHIRPLRDGIKFITIILKMITLFNPIKVFLPLALAWFVMGTFYGLLNFFLNGKIPNGSVLLISISVLIFLAGLISEQIAALRFERSGIRDLSPPPSNPSDDFEEPPLPRSDSEPDEKD